MVDIPTVMQNRGPTPGPGEVIISLKAQADMDENTLVTFGTEDGTCAKAGATDFLLGWTQGKAVDTEMASIHLYAPAWKALMASNVAAVSFGDTLESYAGGLVKAAVSGSGNTIAGKALMDAAAGTYIVFMPITTIPTATSS